MTNTRKRSRMATCRCRNQDGSPCSNAVQPGTLFCMNHQNCEGSPLSGYEPRYDPGRYNNDPAVYKSHNCYSYSMNVIDGDLVSSCRQNNAKECRSHFHQPGALNGDRYALNAVDRRTCPTVEKLMKSDVPEIQPSSFEATCPTGMSKIALVVDKGEDYHYYRQDADGLWSHKDGSNKVKRFDADKKPIFNPETANRDYTPTGSDLNYDDFCGFYCVPRATTVRLGQGGMRIEKTRRQKKQKGGSAGEPDRILPFSQVAGLSWRDHHRQRDVTRKVRKAAARKAKKSRESRETREAREARRRSKTYTRQ